MACSGLYEVADLGVSGAIVHVGDVEGRSMLGAREGVGRKAVVGIVERVWVGGNGIVVMENESITDHYYNPCTTSMDEHNEDGL